MGVYCYLTAAIIDDDVPVHSVPALGGLLSRKVLTRCWGPNYVLAESLQRAVILLRSRSGCSLLDLVTIVHYETAPCRHRDLAASSTALSLTLGDFMLILMVGLSLVYRVRPFQVLRRRIENCCGPLHAGEQARSVCVDGVAWIDPSCNAIKSLERVVQATHPRHHSDTLPILILALALVCICTVVLILICKGSSAG